jgi:hypothetical protein
MAGDAQKKALKRAGQARLYVGISIAAVNLLFFLVRFLLRSWPEWALLEWGALLLSMGTQAGAGYLVVGSKEKGGKAEGSLDLLAVALCAQLLAAWDRRAWWLALIIPLYGSWLVISWFREAASTVSGLVQTQALGQAKQGLAAMEKEEAAAGPRKRVNHR